MTSDDAHMDRFRALVQAIVSGEGKAAENILQAAPHLAKERAVYGATRQAAEEHFYKEILRYIVPSLPKI